MVKGSIAVQTYSGYKADERPVSLIVANRRFEVREILISGRRRIISILNLSPMMGTSIS